MGDSLLIGGAKLGMDVRLCGPKSLWPDKSIVKMALDEAKQNGARILPTEDVQQGVAECDVNYTDVWVSMGEPESVWADRIKLLMPYHGNTDVMSMTGNPQTKFMHCLPAFHYTETEVGLQIQKSFGLDAMEVTEEVFESDASVVFDQAKNRMHRIKAVLVATPGRYEGRRSPRRQCHFSPWTTSHRRGPKVQNSHRGQGTGQVAGSRARACNHPRQWPAGRISCLAGWPLSARCSEGRNRRHDRLCAATGNMAGIGRLSDAEGLLNGTRGTSIRPGTA